MEGFSVARTSELIVGEPVAEGGGENPTIYHVPVTLNLRDFGAKPTPFPRIVSFYYASDADGFVSIDGPDGVQAGVVQTVLDTTGVLNPENLSAEAAYTGRLVVQTTDGVVVSPPLNIPAGIIP